MKTFTSPSDFFEFITAGDKIIRDIHLINPEMVKVQYEQHEMFVQGVMTSNVVSEPPNTQQLTSYEKKGIKCKHYNPVFLG